MRFATFEKAIESVEAAVIIHGELVDTGSWQGVPTKGQPSLVTRELTNAVLDVPIPEFKEQLEEAIKPNLPWAEDHFQERVGRVGTNPGEEYKNWPWWRGQDGEVFHDHGKGKVFTHTYQERFWPNHLEASPPFASPVLEGIRYHYGDLDDVVDQLFEQPMTRQATFPIFFPEDTGAKHGGRVPCTLHYHFLLRRNQLSMWYPIRSCDLVRHFRDDLYMACRLNQWVLDELREKELRGDKPQLWWDVVPGMLHFTAYSLHVHRGDEHLVPRG